jgi:preprotein translocase subunit YajC
MPDANAVSPGAAMFSSLMPIFLIFIVFYFLLIRPQTKKQKEHQKMLDNLKKGDRIITASGMYGSVHEIQGNIVKLRISDNVNVQLLKSAIATVVKEGEVEVISK